MGDVWLLRLAVPLSPEELDVLTGFLDESAMRGVAYSNLAALAAGMRHAFRTPALWNKDRHDSTLEGSMCSQFVCISLRKVCLARHNCGYAMPTFHGKSHQNGDR